MRRPTEKFRGRLSRPPTGPDRFSAAEFGNGNHNSCHLLREFIRQTHRLPPLTTSRKCLFNLRPLWMLCTFQVLISCQLERAFHIIRLLCTAYFAPPVGEVGNTGRHRPQHTSFSKTPEFHNRNLENRATLQLPTLQTHPPISHFSSPNYGYYCLFSYSPIRF